MRIEHHAPLDAFGNSPNGSAVVKWLQPSGPKVCLTLPRSRLAGFPVHLPPPIGSSPITTQKSMNMSKQT
ncbi:hypothetical protein Hanom_Chr12g01080921 [Helianthus anomalus]